MTCGNRLLLAYLSAAAAAVLLIGSACIADDAALTQPHQPSFLVASVAPDSDEPSTGPTAGSPKKKGAVKPGQLIVAPIPFINPTLENGLILGVGYLFRPDRQDKISPLSAVGAAYFETSNSSNGYGGGGKFYLKEDRYRLLGLYARASINYDLFLHAVPVPIEQSANGYLVEVLTRIAPKVYAGPRYISGDVSTSLGREPGPLDIPPKDLDTSVRAPGFRAQWDTRNNPIYPTKGQFLDVQCNFASSESGRLVSFSRDYQTYWIAYNNYRSLGKRAVLASRTYLQFTGGDAPFYALALYGQNSDLRGYSVGKYLGRTMWDVQSEYRRKITKKLGAVAFAGVGGTAEVPIYGTSGTFLPSGGVGVRYMLDEESGLNYRVDFALASGESAVYFAVGEAY